MTTKANPALGPSAWIKKVRELTPGQMPFVVQIAFEAYEAGVSAEEFVAALPEQPPRMTNWVAFTERPRLSS